MCSTPCEYAGDVAMPSTCASAMTLRSNSHDSFLLLLGGAMSSSIRCRLAVGPQAVVISALRSLAAHQKSLTSFFYRPDPSPHRNLQPVVRNVLLRANVEDAMVTSEGSTSQKLGGGRRM